MTKTAENGSYIGAGDLKLFAKREQVYRRRQQRLSRLARPVEEGEAGDPAAADAAEYYGFLAWTFRTLMMHAEQKARTGGVVYEGPKSPEPTTAPLAPMPTARRTTR